LDFISIKKTSDRKSYPEDEIRSIMGRAIPPEWTVNLLALGKEPWRFKDLEDQLNMHRQQWQADQQKILLHRWLERCQTSPMMEKEKIMIEIITIPMEDAVILAKVILAAEDVEEDVVEEETIVSI
jgi:hypothetical protein